MRVGRNNEKKKYSVSDGKLCAKLHIFYLLSFTGMTLAGRTLFVSLSPKKRRLQ